MSNSMFNTFMNGGMIKSDFCISKNIIKLLCTILFPPLGIILEARQNEWKGADYVNEIIISIILTMLFYFPGLIYSFNKITF